MMSDTSSFSSRCRLALCAGAGLLWLAPAAAFAQAAPQAADSADASGGLEEIVVTAQKRSENVQNVPISITALSSDQLKSANIASTEDLRAAVPALNVTTAVGGFGLPRIRGIGATGQGPGIENPVAVFVDGVYYGSAFSVLQSLYDIDQLAVLKGPQGTLFGRNATGGLIQISTLGPSFTPTFKGEVGYGNYNTISGSGYATTGLTEKIAVSLSGQYSDRKDGFGKNLFTGHDVQTEKNWAARAKLLIKPDEDTSILLAGDFNGKDSTEPAFRNFALNSLGQNVTTQITALGGNPDRDIYADTDPSLRARQHGVSVTASHDFGGATLKSITAYRKSELRTIFDPDGTTRQNIVIDNNQYDRQFTQEINLLSEEGGPFKWVIGAFYMNDSGGFYRSRTTGLLTFGGNGFSDNVNSVKLQSIAGFAEGTYSIDDATHVTAGIRYTDDQRDLKARTVTFNGATGVTTTSAQTNGSRAFKKATWKLSVDHRFSPELLGYASYNRGFRSGTYIPQATPIVLLQPEVVDAYEVGIKSDLLDRTLRVNLAGYYYNEKNIQVMQVISGVQNVYNADGAHIYGLDGDVTWKPARDLRLFGGFNYIHARYTTFNSAILSTPYPLPAGFTIPTGQTCLGTFGNPFTQLGGNCLLRGSASGNKLQNTPTFTASVGGSFDVPTDVGKFTLAGNYYYNAGFVGTPDERVKQKAYNTVDASLTWRATDDHLYVRGYVRNLTNAFYRTQIGASNSGDNGTNGAPRTYGVAAGFNF